MHRALPEIAVLGAGAVTTERHLPALQAVGGRAASIFDPSAAAAERAARTFGIPHVASRFEDAVENASVRAVLIASPNAFHAEQALHALATGRHVLCEKPIALTLADSAAMRRAAQHSGRVLQIGFHHRFSSEHLCARRLIGLGVLGRVRAFTGSISEPLEVIPGGFRNYRFDAHLGGGFTLMDVGQHRIDQLRDLLGDVAAVSCDMASVLDGHDKDDSVTLSLRMESGAIGSLHWNRFSRAFTSPLLLYGTRATLGCSSLIAAPFQSAPLALFCERDPVEILPEDVLAWTRPTRWWGDVTPGWVSIWPPRSATFEEQFRNFFAAIEGREAPRSGATDGHMALEVVQAAYESVECASRVPLPLDTAFRRDPPSWTDPAPSATGGTGRTRRSS